MLKGSALKYVDKEFKADREVVLAAIKQSSEAREYADEKLIAELKEEGLLEDN